MNYNDLITLKRNLCNNYLTLYKNDGYIIIPPLPLDNKEDITVDFTTCTICSAKKNITNNSIGEDYVMIQPALRNTHINNLNRIKEKNFFFSYFTMIGGFHYYRNDYKKELNDVICNEFSFLSRYGNYIILTIPNQYKDMIEINDDTIVYLKEHGCVIKYSDDDAKNLKWKYGMDGVAGFGTRWEISNGGDLVNYGNTISVYKNGIPFGVDFGGGVESLIYANKKLRSSIYANDALTDNCRIFCEEDTLNEKIIDCIVSAMCILSNKEKIQFRDKIILDSYIRILYSLMIIKDISKEKVLSIIDEINNINIEVLNKDDMIEVFNENLLRIENDFMILLDSNNINHVIKLMNICYNENEEWLNNKKIIMSHYKKYFTNLSEVELLAIKKKKLIIERGNTND